MKRRRAVEVVSAGDADGRSHVVADFDRFKYRRADRDTASAVWRCTEWIGVGPLTWRTAEHTTASEAEAVQWIGDA